MTLTTDREQPVAADLSTVRAAEEAIRHRLARRLLQMSGTAEDFLALHGLVAARRARKCHAGVASSISNRALPSDVSR
jgi:hypothetical protein